MIERRGAAGGGSSEPWVWAVLLLIGAGPWLFIDGTVVWELVFSTCKTYELHPPPSGEMLFVFACGWIWLGAVGIVSTVLIVLRKAIIYPTVAIITVVGASFAIMAVGGPFVESIPWNGQYAKCYHPPVTNKALHG